MNRSRPGPQRQRGFGLLAFVLAASAFGMALVFGYSGVWTKEQLFESKVQKRNYVNSVVEKLEAAYPSVAFDMDSSRGNAITGEDIVKYLNHPSKWELKAEKSNLLTDSEGLTYRTYAFWLGTHEGDVDMPDITYFKTTGKMRCGTEACDESFFMTVWSSQEVSRKLANDTEKAMERIVKKAQVYFKARQLQDPEKTVSINYFYKPSNVCAIPNSLDLGCLTTYTNVAAITKTGDRQTIVPAQFAKNLALSDADLVSGWGLPIQISAVEDAEYEMTPYTLAIRAMRPDGTFIKKTAIQQF